MKTKIRNKKSRAAKSDEMVENALGDALRTYTASTPPRVNHDFLTQFLPALNLAVEKLEPIVPVMMPLVHRGQFESQPVMSARIAEAAELLKQVAWREPLIEDGHPVSFLPLIEADPVSFVRWIVSVDWFLNRYAKGERAELPSPPIRLAG